MLYAVPDIVKVTAKDTVIKKLSMVYYKKVQCVEYAETVWRLMRLKDFYIRKISLRNYRRFESKYEFADWEERFGEDNRAGSG